MFYKYGLIILVWMFITGFKNNYAQSQSELVKNGITKYIQGNYTEAMRYFDMALSSSNFAGTKISYGGTSQGNNATGEIKAEMRAGNDYLTGVSTKNYVETSRKELTNSGVNQSDQLMLNNNVELSQIYLYKGRINLHLKQYSLAVQNFAKGMNLNPSYNKSNIGYAIVTKLQGYFKVCEDLKIAMEEGSNSAKIIYKNICE